MTKEFVSQAEERRYNRSAAKKEFKCSICGHTAIGFGHNPEPILPYEKRCCDICNTTIVVPIRIFGLQAHSSLADLKRFGYELKFEPVAKKKKR